MTHSLPLVGVPACVRNTGIQDYHMAAEKYLKALYEGAGVMPIIIPALAEETVLIPLIDRLDGLLLTGSRSDVAPQHYEGGFSRKDQLHDDRRDGTTLPLIRMAVEQNLPMLGICRGIQEINVALGGTLHNAVHSLEGRMDHRADEEAPADVQFALKHDVDIQPGGLLASLLEEARVTVNSAHGQGIDRMAERLAVEAVAPDGQIEAVRVTHPELPSGDSFQIGVQWHPEWNWRKDTTSRMIFSAFGDAVRNHARLREEEEHHS